MFEAKKTLIVVYKDELLMNQLKKMVETPDDNGNDIIGTRDDSINIVSWSEKVWMDNKKSGVIKGKILFLGEIKGTDKLIPVIDSKFDEYGVKFGWAGNQAILYTDSKELTNRKNYDAFLKKLSELPVPSFLKGTKESTNSASKNHEAYESVESSTNDVLKNSDTETILSNAKKHKKVDILKGVKKVFSTGADAIEEVGAQVASKSEEVFRNKSLMKRQMLFYGVVNLYNNWLEEFMNM